MKPAHSKFSLPYAYDIDDVTKVVDDVAEHTNQIFKDYVIPLSNELYSEYIRHKNAFALTQKTLKKTGIIDIGRLYAYKTSDNIFKKKTILPKGKNHGIVLGIDNSASMRSVFHEVLANAAAIAHFCNRAKVKLKCFTFTGHTVYQNGTDPRGYNSVKGDIDSSIDSRVSDLREVFNENMTLDTIRNIYYEALLCISFNFDFYDPINRKNDSKKEMLIKLGVFADIEHAKEVIVRWHQQATPLAIANIAALQLADEMRRSDVEHVSIVMLTDGDNNVGITDNSNRFVNFNSRYDYQNCCKYLSYKGETYNVENFRFYGNPIFKVVRSKRSKFDGMSGIESEGNTLVFLVNEIIRKNDFEIHQINLGKCKWLSDVYSQYLKSYKNTGIFHEKGILGFTSVTCLDIEKKSDSTQYQESLYRRNIRKFLAKQVVSYICDTFK